MVVGVGIGMDAVRTAAGKALGNYGHRARKLTWLFVASDERPQELDWSIPETLQRLDYGFHSAAERKALKSFVAPAINAGRLTSTENLATPPAFRDLLLDIARSARVSVEKAG